MPAALVKLSGNSTIVGVRGVVDRDRGADVDRHARGGRGERQVGGRQGGEDDRLVESHL